MSIKPQNHLHADFVFNPAQPREQNAIFVRKPSQRHEKSAETPKPAGPGTGILEGVKVYLTGYLGASIRDIELRRLIVQHGGNVSSFFAKHAVTHVVCTNLAFNKIEKFKKDGDIKVVSPDWIIDSVNESKRLPELKYLKVAATDTENVSSFKTCDAARRDERRKVLQEMSAHINEVVENIRKATKGFGTNEKLLIEAILSLSHKECVELDAYYKANYGKSVLDVIQSECGGHFGKLLAALCAPEAVTAAKSLNKAMKGMGTDEKLLIETLIGRSNAEINAIKYCYHELFQKNLEDEVRSELSGESKKFFTMLLQAMRDENGTLFTNIDADVELLYKSGEGRMGTDETEIFRVFLTRNEVHLARVFDAYAHKHGHAMEKVVKKEFTGMAETVLLKFVHYIHNRGLHFADYLEEAMHGMGTDEGKLDRLIIRLRGTYLMPLTKEAYLGKYDKTLELRIKGETSGDHEKLLIALINQPAFAYY